MRWFKLALVSLSVSLATPAFAQQADPAQNDPRQLLQQLRENMQNNNVNLRDLTQNLREQAQNGTLNGQTLQQQLIDSGVVTQDMINNYQNQVQNYQQQRNGQGGVNPTTLQTMLGCNNDEWAVLYPKIQKVVDLSNQLSQGVVSTNYGRMNTFTVGQPQGRGGVAGAASAQNAVAAALAELNALLADENAPSSDIKEKLTVLRQVKEKVKTELNSAEADLIALITLRQEGILLTLAYIQ